MNKKYMWIWPGLLFVMAGCAGTRIDSVVNPDSPGKDIPTLIVAESQTNQVNLPEPAGALTLRQALGQALMKNPSLEAQAWEVRAAEARTLQARLIPNPELEFEIEEYDRDGEGSDSSETVVSLGQVIELGGKRRWRARVARAEGELAGWDYERKRLDVFTETTTRFVDVIAAQQRLDLGQSTVKLAKQTSESVNERVKAGKEPPLQSSKATAELEITKLTQLDAEGALKVARKRLAAMWGTEKPVFDKAQGDIKTVLDRIPSPEILRSHLSSSPALARLDAELRLRKAEMASEKWARVPDVEAVAGIQSFEEDGTEAYAFGVGIPLPLFDRNQGAIAAAEHAIRKAQAEKKASVIDLAVSLAEIQAELQSAHRRVLTMKTKVVPAMEQAFDSARKGYMQGKFGFMDVLDAQRGMFDAKHELVDALSAYHSSLADVQRITGTCIEDLMKKKEGK